MDNERVLDNYFYDHVIDNLDHKTLMTLHNYTVFDYRTINKYLLGTKVSKRTQDRLDNEIELIKSGIEKSSLPIPITVYHGTNISLLNNVSLEEYLSKTNKVMIKTFLSTSTSEYIAGSFCGYKPHNSLVLEINLPVGYPALWLGGLSFHHDERELLLLNNVSLEITGSEYQHYHKLIHTRLL